MEELNCRSVRGSLWDFLEGSTGDLLRRRIAAHLSVCRECDSHRREAMATRSGLKQLPSREVPAMLTTRLLVGASRERARRAEGESPGAWLRERKSRLRLFVDNLLKPFAVPAAGGLLTSFLCFGVIVNSLHVSSAATWDNDIPLGISTEIAIDELSPFTCDGHDVMVQLTVDSGGNVTDYLIPGAEPSPDELREIANLVLYSSFTPAMRLGQAISSKRLFYIRHISIKG